MRQKEGTRPDRNGLPRTPRPIQALAWQGGYSRALAQLGRAGVLVATMWPNLAVAMFAVVVSTLTAASAVAQSALIKRGQAIAERHCARCHAISPVGESPMTQAPPFRSSRYPVDHLAEALAEGIVTGHPAMPEFKFSPDEIGGLLTFMDSLAPRGARDGERK